MYLPEDAFPALYLDRLLACGKTPYPTKILLTPDLNTTLLRCDAIQAGKRHPILDTIGLSQNGMEEERIIQV